MNNKGEFNLGVIKVILLTLMIMAIFVVVGMIVNLELRTVTENIGSYSARETNESITATSDGTYLTANKYRNADCTIVTVLNATGNILVSSGNYTVTGCLLSNSSQICTATDCVMPWRVTYTYTYDLNDAYYIESNFSGGAAKFFSYVPTFMILLAVVVLILIIAVVVTVVTRFGGGSSSFNT